MEHNKAYPLTDYIKSCKKIPNCEYSIENWAIKKLLAEDTRINRWGGKAMHLTWVARVLEPGCPQRTIPMLIGAPGIGKSSAIGAFLPPEFADYFTDDFSFEADNKAKIEQTKDHVIVEITELGGIRKAEVAETKSFLNRTVDKVRLVF